ncbi:MAG: septal ring lytic transglycosylase RlpA family protein [Proteobacteria bacterium]|nr:septal ring lytic transglycosylase RlpA family protein [Pseudomonadota bacterium]
MGDLTRYTAISLIGTALLLGACAEMQLAVYSVKRAQDAAGSPTVPKSAAADSKSATTGARPVYKVGRPYQIKGVWYYPREDPNYDTTGIASWYGTDFHGKTTANGEIYDMNALTAAHKTLPMPSSVRVTNLENGRSIVLRVNDRGPFVHGRIIDVSRRASQLLGFHQRGTAKIRVAVLQEGGKRFIAKPATTEEEASLVAAVPRDGVTSQALPPPKGIEKAPTLVAAAAPDPEVSQQGSGETSIFVQAGAFSSRQNADRLRDKLAGVGPVSVSQTTIKGRVFHRVRLGPLGTVHDADAALARVMQSGYPGARIVVDCAC